MSRWIYGGSGKIWRTECKYKPSARNYPGDEKMIPYTQQSHIQRTDRKTRGPGRSRKNDQEIEAVREDSVTAGDLEKASRRNGSQICGDLSRLKKHIKSVENRRKHGNKCVVCAEMAYSVCKLCGNKDMHFFLQKWKCSGKDCFMDYHNEVFFGLALDDTTLINKQKSEWTPPNIRNRQKNEQHIKSLRAHHLDYALHIIQVTRPLTT